MNRLSLVAAVEALRLDLRPDFAHVYPTPDELDAADALELVHGHHVPAADEVDEDGRWGACAGCEHEWPCPAWGWAERLAVQWMGRAQDRYAAGRSGLMEATSLANPTAREAS